MVAEASRGLTGLVDLLDDDRMREAVEAVVRTHLVAPLWGPPLGRLAERVLSSGGHHEAVDLLLDRLDEWLAANPEALRTGGVRRLPSWLPSFVDRVIDERLHSEPRRFVRDVRDDPDHRLRRSLDEYLAQFADRLQHDEATIERLEAAKGRAFDDPRIRELAASAWAAARTAAIDALSDEDGELRGRAEAFVADIARRVLTDAELGASLNSAADRRCTAPRDELPAATSRTSSPRRCRRWDPAEITDKIETQVGRDLQFIRINGTVVGALAGLAIYTIATLVAAAF